MRFHPEEQKSALEYWKDRPFPGMSKEQYKVIAEKGKEMIRFHLRHPSIHHLINFAVFAIIFSVDWWVLLRLGSYMKSPIIAGIVVGFLHSYIMYSLIVFTIHEGAAHKLIVLRNGPVSKFFSVIANNIGRIALPEADYYAKNHMIHHAKYTTAEDAEYLYFVYPKRLFKSLIPYASIFNIGDFKTHIGYTYTPSRLFSIAIFLVYHGILVTLMAQRYSWTMIVTTIVLVAPNTAFWLDRLRQYTEHNIMPLTKLDAARDLGLGFWGMLIGGGPWGQPCHWTHHLMPGVPWYNQLRLHNVVKKVLTQEQRKVFFLNPIIGFPLKLIEIIRTTAAYQR